jgi:hypothetical protein
VDQTLAIDVQVSGAQQGASQIKGVGTAVSGVGKETEETSKQTSALRNTLSGLATGFAVYKGAQYIKSAVTETTGLAKATITLTRLTGMDSQTASAWVGIAQERNISAKQLNTGFITLSKQLVALSQGSKTATVAFGQLGLSQAQLQGKSTQQAIDLISNSLANLPPGADKAALAQKLLGRSAQQLLPLLNQGSDALNEQIGVMGKQLGMTDSTVKNSLKLVQTQREWEATMMGLKVAIATALLPIITQLAQIIEPLAQGFATAMRSSEAFRVIVISLTAALTTFIVVTKALALAGISVDAAFSPWLVIPAIIVGIGVALVMLYNKVGWFRDGVNAAFTVIKAVFVAVFNWVKANWPLLAGILFGPFGLAAGEIVQHWTSVKNTVVGIFNTIKGAVTTVGSAISSALAGAFNTVSKSIQAVVSGINSIVNTAKKITGLPGKVLNVLGGGISGIASSLNPFGAHGLYASQSGTAVVGEHGPEIVNLPQGSTVRPFGGLTGRGGGGPVQIHTHVYIGKRQIALAIGDYVADTQAAR